MSESCCDSCGHAPAASRTESLRLWLVAISGAAIGLGMLARLFDQYLLGTVAFLLVIAVSIWSPARRAIDSVGRRSLDINVLMVIAVIGAAALGDWLEAAVVVWLFGVAQWLEGRSHERARRALRSLMSLAPSQALVRRDDREEIVPVADVAIGDIAIVRPGERVPVDGIVISGESALDQSSLTGEPWPVERGPGQEVFAGSINGTGALEIAVHRLASESTLSCIVRSVEQAQAQRAPVQRFVDRFARGYTPSVVGLALVLAIVPPLVMGGGAATFAVWTYRALALLVVACPCALVISTPVSIVSALTAAARHGVLIKTGADLERLGSVRCVAFDKTGTLTHGRISVTEVLSVEGRSTDGVLSVAAALESRSEHPIGRAIVARARQDGLDVAPGERFRALPGLGAEAQVAAAPAIVGSHRLFEERQLCTPSLHAQFEQVSDRGGTAVLVGHDGEALGVIGLSDETRRAGRQAIAGLRKEGVNRVVLLTGDSRANADAIVTETGLDEGHAELMPDDKVRLVANLRAQYGPVAMVGDGINDAPALAAADVGIAMGAAGSDVALETADVALMADDLAKLPFAIHLGRRALANIRTNIVIALGLKLAFVVLAASGVATLWMAIVADTGASLLVTMNSLRLLKVRR